MPDHPSDAPTPLATAWDAQGLWRSVQPHWPDLSIEIADQLPSTNQHLVTQLHEVGRQAQGRELRAQDLHPHLLVAQRQTAGRGRLGRQWTAQPGASLTFSLQLALSRPDWSGLSLAVGLALAQALDPTGLRIGLKWPNDVWLLDAPGHGRKLGGILIEGLSVQRQRVAVIGIGLNIWPVHMAQPVASLDEHLPGIQAAQALHRVVPALLDMLRAFEHHGFAPLVPAYARYDLLRGQPVRTTQADCPEGLAQGVAEDGALCVQPPHAPLVRIVSGEVSVRPGAQPLPFTPAAPGQA